MRSRHFFSCVLVVPLLIGQLTWAKPPNPAAAAPKQPLSWRYVESEDYRTYVANLRSIGCPDQTIRDIVTADVISVFAPRRTEALRARYQNYQYWKADASETVARATLSAQRRGIDAEMDRVLQGLLGDDTALPDVSREWQSADLDFRLSFLPPDKLAQAKAILLEHDHTELLAQRLTTGDCLTEDTNELNNIVDAHEQDRDALRHALSPEEFNQVEMAASWTGDNLRHAMVHFGPTEEEFRFIFAAWKAHDESLIQSYAAREPDPGNDDVYAQIKSQMTPERFQLYRDTWWR